MGRLFMRRLLMYSKEFGLLKSIYLIFKLKFSDEIVKLNFPKLAHPIYLRGRTSDAHVFDEIFFDEAYKLTNLTKCNLIIDAGANIGLTSVYYANHYPQATIIAIEPDSSNVDILKRNVSAYPNIKIEQAALWKNLDVYLKIENPTANKWEFRVIETTNPQNSIKAVTIPYLMDKYGISFLDILKIDIEGSERFVFAENYLPWITQFEYLIIELHDRWIPNCGTVVFNALSGLNYSIEDSGYNTIIHNKGSKQSPDHD